jgi:NAD(P)-dependent dehydrogenase (short-subunit alcohol dehydrogenase family)
MRSESADAYPDLPTFRLDGRLAIVTGASAGIGRAFALAYARAGAEVVLVSRSEDKLIEVRSEVEAFGGRAHVVCADLSKMDDIRLLPERVNEFIGGRNLSLVLVNNAGFGFTRAALQVTEEDWDRVLDLHAKGTFFCSQSIGRMMIERGYGKIINLSSTWSASTAVGKSVYGLAKAAVSYLTAALSTEWAPLGVRVNALAPTTTLSNNTKHTLDENPARAGALLNRIKLGRFAEPADLVGSALFLAGPASDFITGHTLFVDGGWHAFGE